MDLPQTVRDVLHDGGDCAEVASRKHAREGSDVLPVLQKALYGSIEICTEIWLYIFKVVSVHFYSSRNMITVIIYNTGNRDNKIPPDCTGTVQTETTLLNPCM